MNDLKCRLDKEVPKFKIGMQISLTKFANEEFNDEKINVSKE